MIATKTVLTQLRLRSLFRHALALLPKLAEASSIDEDTMLGMLYDYCHVSARFVADTELMPYLACGVVTQDEFERVFLEFLNAPEQIGNQFFEVVSKISTMDAPQTEPHQHPQVSDIDPNF